MDCLKEDRQWAQMAGFSRPSQTRPGSQVPSSASRRRTIKCVQASVFRWPLQVRRGRDLAQGWVHPEPVIVVSPVAADCAPSHFVPK